MRRNCGVAKLGHKIVDADDAGQEEWFVAERKHLLLEEESCAAVVEDYQDAVDVVLVLVPDAVCYGVEEGLHLMVVFWFDNEDLGLKLHKGTSKRYAL